MSAQISSPITMFQLNPLVASGRMPFPAPPTPTQSQTSTAITSSSSSSLTNAAKTLFDDPDSPRSQHSTSAMSPIAEETSDGDGKAEDPTTFKATFSPSGQVKDLPASMLIDPFGLAALLVAHKVAETGPAPLVFGDKICDEFMALRETSSEILQGSYGGPFSAPVEPAWTTELAPELQVYPEYQITSNFLTESKMSMDNIRKLFCPQTHRFSEDLLFYIFYSFPRDQLQLVAASQLYAKGWRFHTEFKVWLQRIPGAYIVLNNGTCERGDYKCFDSSIWKIVKNQLFVDLSKLEGPPNLPIPVNANSNNDV